LRHRDLDNRDAARTGLNVVGVERRARRSDPADASGPARDTWVVTANLSLSDRGLLQRDRVVFVPATVRDRATYDEPEQPPISLPGMLVNGVFAVRDGVDTGARAGQVLTF
jgi:N-acyl-D-aspartate/D-glutamate deacylase